MPYILIYDMVISLRLIWKKNNSGPFTVYLIVMHFSFVSMDNSGIILQVISRVTKKLKYLFCWNGKARF